MESPPSAMGMKCLEASEDVDVDDEDESGRWPRPWRRPRPRLKRREMFPLNFQSIPFDAFFCSEKTQGIKFNKYSWNLKKKKSV